MRHGPKDQIIRHIGFAERWLSRAKAECRDGNVARGLLTLLLAEAEVHHARAATSTAPDAQPSSTHQESDAGRAPRTRSRRLTLLAAVGGTTAGALAAFSFLAGAPGADQVGGATTAPPIVRFGNQVGSVLALVPSPAPERRERAVVAATEGLVEEDLAAGGLSRGVIPRGTRRSGRFVAGGVRKPASTARSATSTGVAPRSVSRRPAAASVRPAAPPLLSDGELIELVLAAERSLRSGTR